MVFSYIVFKWDPSFSGLLNKSRGSKRNDGLTRATSKDTICFLRRGVHVYLCKPYLLVCFIKHKIENTK